METKKKTLLWLDDYRNPFDTETNWLVFSPIPLENLHVVWVKNFVGFVDFLESNGLPDAVCFDHDLGEEESGKDCANYLVDYCLDHKKPLPLYSSQSANRPGKENILGLLNQAKEYLKQYEDNE